jgi:hypothetical protein
MDDADHTLKSLYKEVHLKNKQIEELQVLIDTLQTNLRSAVSLIDTSKRSQITNVQSYKWCANWRPGQ